MIVSAGGAREGKALEQAGVKNLYLAPSTIAFCSGAPLRAALGPCRHMILVLAALVALASGVYAGIFRG